MDLPLPFFNELRELRPLKSLKEADQNAITIDQIIYVELLENYGKQRPLSQLEPEAYSRYILDCIRGADAGYHPYKKYVMYGISMGTLHALNFAAHFPNNVLNIVLVEPTICSGDYNALKLHERARGNYEWITKLHREPKPFMEAPVNEQVVDIAVSLVKKHHPPPYIPIFVNNTSMDASGVRYGADALMSKRLYLRYLRELTYDVTERNWDAPHCLDLEPELRDDLARAIYEWLNLRK